MTGTRQPQAGTAAPPRPGRGGGLAALFTLTSFTTAALLFLVQPMAARMVLPAFGGSPQVWTTSMLFFQTALLAGYAYSHVATSRLAPRRQPVLHVGLALLPLIVLPIALDVAPSGRGGVWPTLELLAALLIGVAAPYLLVATSGPLVQRWFSWTDHPRAADPYFLYAAGNLGSVTGLVGYPFVLERVLSVRDQSVVWAAGYAVACLLLAACAWAVRSRRSPDRPSVATADTSAAPVEDALPVEDAPPVQDAPPVEDAGPPLTRRRVLRWVLLAFVPSSAMLAATTHLSTDVAAVPMLWIVPLAVYLLTFSLAFSRAGPRLTRWAAVAVPVVVVAALVLDPGILGLEVAVATQIAFVAVAGLFCHGRLAADRPAPRSLTAFYVWLAVGGALGGLLNGIVAPLLFPTVIEHGLTAALLLAVLVDLRAAPPGATGLPRPLRLAPAWLVALAPVLLATAFQRHLRPGTVAAWLAVGVVLASLASRYGRSRLVLFAVVGLAVVPSVRVLAGAAAVERTFFGVHIVQRDADEVRLMHGTTLHGTQDLRTAQATRTATTYYHPDGPFGALVTNYGDAGDIGVIGLGTGATAAYGRAGQRIVFHEIDPAVVRIARQHFSYLDDSAADIEMILGDGRLTLDEAPAPYALLAVDAFTSDAIPVHLLTLEAVTGYLDAVAPDGVVAIHISNRHLDLGRVLDGAARELGVHALDHQDPGDAGRTSSRWVALARDAETLAPLRDTGFVDLAPDLTVVWTDQRSDLVSVLDGS